MQVCKKLPFVIPTAVVKQSTKVHGPLVILNKVNQTLLPKMLLIPDDLCSLCKIFGYKYFRCIKEDLQEIVRGE